ncbi:MFS general substrate transporter [Trichodelitschia bisporula]|uniref:MFS general substrate transporter n=1 Tax=Trichodelitschia bisporula TaxID=703511 RepID=A0A6G1HXC4_9PEZI|nr:MFS general substrate transporter [Trichodelitschia bisporula]
MNSDMKPTTEVLEGDEKKQFSVEEVSRQPTSSIDDERDGKMTKEKWLALISLGLAYMTAFQQSATLGGILKSIDNALGPTTYYNWILSALTISSAISLPLSGGLSDIFGRRYFMIAGGFISLVSAIMGLVAKNIPTMIAMSAVAGLGSGSQQLALAAVSEIVPNRLRGRVQACIDLVVLPWTVFGAITGGAMVTQHGKYGFRINFIVGLILNVLSIVTAYFWYFPPSAGLRLGNQTRRAAFIGLDWMGVFLLNTAVILLLVGIALGGETYPWSHAGVVAPLVLSAVLLVALWFWEAYYAKNPFMAHELFIGKTRTFTMFLVIDFVAGMGLYAALAFWALLVRGMWEGTPMKVGVLVIPGGFGAAFGGFTAGMLIGRGRFFTTPLMLFYGTCFKCIADMCTTLIMPHGAHAIPFGLGIGFLSMIGTGWLTVTLIVCVQLACEDQDIGLATLLLGSVRAIGGSVAINIYTALLNNEVKKQAGPMMARAVLKLGVPASTLPKLIGLLIVEKHEAAGKLPGMTPHSTEVARETMKLIWAKGFHKVYLCAGAFAGAAIIAAVLSKDVSGNMTGHVAARLENEKERPKEVEEGRSL